MTNIYAQLEELKRQQAATTAKLIPVPRDCSHNNFTENQDGDMSCFDCGLIHIAPEEQ